MCSKRINSLLYCLFLLFFSIGCKYKSPNQYFAKAEILFEKDELEKANNLLNKALELGSNFLEAYIK